MEARDDMGDRIVYSLHTDADEVTARRILAEKLYGGQMSMSLSEIVASGEEWKWYEWHEDMIRISAKYPAVTMRLDGAGEESLDVWCCWFKAGEELARVKAAMPPDPEGLPALTNVTELPKPDPERLEYERLKAKFGG